MRFAAKVTRHNSPILIFVPLAFRRVSRATLPVIIFDPRFDAQRWFSIPTWAVASSTIPVASMQNSTARRARKSVAHVFVQVRRSPPLMSERTRPSLSAWEGSLEAPRHRPHSWTRNVAGLGQSSELMRSEQQAHQATSLTSQLLGLLNPLSVALCSMIRYTGGARGSGAALIGTKPSA